MSSEIVGVIQALYNHRGVIDESCMSHSGEILDTTENQAAIRALRKHRLIWQMGSSESITLSRPLLSLLSGARASHRRRLAAGNVDTIWSSIKERTEDYNNALRRGKMDDVERLSLEITDELYELANDISMSIRAFSDYIDHGYAYTKDLALRIKENERAIKKAQQLNDSLEGLDLFELVNASKMDARLRRLFLQDFAQSFAESRSQLVNTLHRLNDLLVKLRSDSELGKLIRCFDLKFKNDPGFTPEPPALIESIPEVVNFAKPLIKAFRSRDIIFKLSPIIGDIYNSSLDESLGKIIRSINVDSVSTRKNNEEERIPVKDTRGRSIDRKEASADHPVIERARHLTLALRRTNKRFSLRALWRDMNDADCPLPFGCRQY